MDLRRRIVTCHHSRALRAERNKIKINTAASSYKDFVLTLLHIKGESHMCCDMIDDGVVVGAAGYWTVASLILSPWNDPAGVDKDVRH